MLRLAKGFELDTDYVGGGTLALLAKKGAGKSYAARVMAEEFWKAKVPFVLIDPMGTSWGLRSSADGKGEGIPVAIFGGEYGDAPLKRESGALMADLVVQEKLSMVLDISDLGSRAAERQFALDFFDRLYRTNRDLVHLLVDEADLFAPQKPQAGDRQLLGVTENIVRRGRNRGIGVTLITQRPAVLNKDVLTQIDALVAMRIVGKTDREAIDAWVAGHGDPEQAAKVKGTLASLGNGESWWWIPELGILERVQVRESETFDSSPTKTRGKTARQPTSYADVDMAAIETRMADTIERAKQTDPKELGRRIRQLESELAKRPEAEPERVEVPVLGPDAVNELGQLVDQAGDVALAITRAARDVAERLAAIKTSGPRGGPAPAVEERQPRAAPVRQRLEPGRGGSDAEGRGGRASARPGDASSNGSLTGPQQRVVDALAWLEAVGFPQPTKTQVGFIAGYRVGKKVGGTYGNILGQLNGDLIHYPAQGTVALTDAGRALAMPPDIEPTTAGLQGAVFARLADPERRVLRAVVDAYPDQIEKVQVGAAAGYTVGDKIGGTFGNILGKLRSLGLIAYPAQGWVVAEPVLFLEH